VGKEDGVGAAPAAKAVECADRWGGGSRGLRGVDLREINEVNMTREERLQIITAAASISQSPAQLEGNVKLVAALFRNEELWKTIDPPGKAEISTLRV